MSVFCCFFSGTASYSRGYTGQKFAFTTSLSWHRLGPWLHPFWLHCSQQFYRVPNIQAVFVPSGLIHGWGVHFGLYCRRRLVTMSLLKFEAVHLQPVYYWQVRKSKCRSWLILYFWQKEGHVNHTKMYSGVYNSPPFADFSTQMAISRVWLTTMNIDPNLVPPSIFTNFS